MLINHIPTPEPLKNAPNAQGLPECNVDPACANSGRVIIDQAAPKTTESVNANTNKHQSEYLTVFNTSVSSNLFAILAFTLLFKLATTTTTSSHSHKVAAAISAKTQ